MTNLRSTWNAPNNRKNIREKKVTSKEQCMTIAIEICQDNFIYCKKWTQNLGVKTSKKPKERVKNQCL